MGVLIKSNKQIDRLGKTIFNNNGAVTDDELELLQEFRISFSQPLVDTFNIIRTLSDKVHRASIIAFRLKRIGTIINKIEREPGMNLSRMGDIAGIRCIFYNEAEVYKAVELIENEFEKGGKKRDYIIEPKPLGYRGVHLYIKDKKKNKRIEIQLRTIKQHNWATLIEITDLLYDLRLKEIGFKSDKDFAKFHSLMSSDKILTKEEANLIYKVLNNRNLISTLSSTFIKNNNAVKKKWSDEDKDNSFFLIEASKNEIPNLQSFKTFEEAESAYFLRYKENIDAEIVLTSIRRPNFKQISIAYANYILSYHNFINDIQPIIKELAIEAIEERKYFKFRTIFKTYEDLQANILFDVLTESTDVFLNRLGRRKIILDRSKNMSKLQERKIQKKVKQKFLTQKKLHNNFMKEIMSNIPKTIIIKQLFTRFLKKSDKRVNDILKGRTVEFINLIE